MTVASGTAPGRVPSRFTLAIDPGTTESAFVVVNAERKPIDFAKMPNADLRRRLPAILRHHEPSIVIEMIASYGMSVGAEVFETCVEIGRLYERCVALDIEPALVKRLPVKMHHCHTAKATDANIRQALVDRFASGVPNHGKGSKAAPGWFHGFAADVWAAYALAVYAADQEGS